jgi:CRP-like cAMP-binding protein
MQNAYIREQLRVIQNLSLSAEERYKSFLTKYPQMANLVKQKQIASYLGITPEFLSSLKVNKTKK